MPTNLSTLLTSTFTGAAGPSNVVNATNDTTTTTLYPVFVGAAGSDQTPKVSTSALSWNAANNYFGIGTSSPSYSLEIKGPDPVGLSDNQLSIMGSETSGLGGTGAGIQFGGHDGVDYGKIWGSIRGLKNTNDVDEMGFLSFSTGTAGLGLTEKMTLGDGGLGISQSLDSNVGLYVENTDNLGTTASASVDVSNIAVSAWLRILGSGYAGNDTYLAGGMMLGTDADNGMMLSVENDYAPMAFATNFLPRMRIGANGMVGIGDVNPDGYSWFSTNGTRAILFGDYASFFSKDGQSTDIGYNITQTATNTFSRNSDGLASRYSQSAGVHTWSTGASGLGGVAVTLTTRLTLNATGELILGSAEGTTAPAGRLLRGPSGGGTNIPGGNLEIAAGPGTGTGGSGNISFQTAPAGTSGTTVNTLTERMRIDSAGNVGIGITPTYPLQVSRSSTTGGLQVLNINLAGTQSADNYADFLFTLGGTPTRAAVIRAITNGSPAGNGHNLAFLTSANGNTPTERMRLTSIGQLSLGSTSPVSAGWLTLNYDGQNYNGLMTRTTTAGTYYGAMFKNVSDAFVGDISVSASATAYNTSSDYRLKDNVAPMTGALSRVALLKPVTYSWKIDGSAGEGFIAHELQEVCPLAVTGEKDAVFEDGAVKSQSIDVSFLVATLTAAIQELKTIVDTQAQRIAVLESR